MKAIEIINAWKNLTDEQQENYCKAAVATALNDRYHLSTGYTFEDAVQDTCLKVLEVLQDPEALDTDSADREAKGKRGNTLGSVINRAAKAGLQRMPTRAGSTARQPATRSPLRMAMRSIRCIYWPQ